MSNADASPPKKKTKKKKRKDKSVQWVITMALILVAVFGWGFMAGAYAINVEGIGRDTTPLEEMPRGRRAMQAWTIASLIRGVVFFVTNSFAQLPNLFGVIGYNFRHNTWLPVTILVLAGIVFLGGIGMKRLDDKLSRPPVYKRKDEPK